MMRLDYFRMKDTVSSYLHKHVMIAVMSYLAETERNVRNSMSMISSSFRPLNFYPNFG